MEAFLGEIIVQVIAGVIVLIVGSLMVVRLRDRPITTTLAFAIVFGLGAFGWFYLRNPISSPASAVDAPTASSDDGSRSTAPDSASSPAPPAAEPNAIVNDPAAPVGPVRPGPTVTVSPIQRARVLADQLAAHQWALDGQCRGNALNFERVGDRLRVWPAGGRVTDYDLVGAQGDHLTLRVDFREVEIQIQPLRYRYIDQGESRWFGRCQ